MRALSDQVLEKIFGALQSLSRNEDSTTKIKDFHAKNGASNNSAKNLLSIQSNEFTDQLINEKLNEKNGNCEVSSCTNSLSLDFEPKYEVVYSEKKNLESDTNSFLIPLNIQNKYISESFNSFQNLKKLLKLFKLINMQKDNKLLINNFFLQFINWIQNWFADERNFCQNCINNLEAWNYEIHRKMAFRYYSFLLYRCIKYLSNFILNDKNINENYIVVDKLRCLLILFEKSFDRITDQLQKEGKFLFLFLFLFFFYCSLHFVSFLI